MTVSEYADAVEQAIEEREMPSWKVIDLRILVKYARKNDRVTSLDLLILSWAGVPYHGPVVYPKSTIDRKLKRQPRLF